MTPSDLSAPAHHEMAGTAQHLAVSCPALSCPAKICSRRPGPAEQAPVKVWAAPTERETLHPSASNSIMWARAGLAATATGSNYHMLSGACKATIPKLCVWAAASPSPTRVVSEKKTPAPRNFTDSNTFHRPTSPPLCSLAPPTSKSNRAWMALWCLSITTALFIPSLLSVACPVSAPAHCVSIPLALKINTAGFGFPPPAWRGLSQTRGKGGYTPRVYEASRDDATQHRTHRCP